MRIVGCLIWFDESESWLATAVAGFGRVCDQIIAVDGSYMLYPGARARSHPAQAEAILAAAEAAGVGCLVHRPQDIFYGNEIEKRNLSLRLAAPFLTEGEDWVLVFDADNHVMQTFPEIVRYELENTRLNAATYTVLDGKDLLADPNVAAMARELPLSTEWTYRCRGIYRWTPDLRYGPAHWTVRGTYDGVEQWVWGPEEAWDIAPAHDLLDSLVVVHRNQHRAKVRTDAAQLYYENRNLAGAESLERGHEWSGDANGSSDCSSPVTRPPSKDFSPVFGPATT